MAEKAFIDWLAEHRQTGLVQELEEAWRLVNRGVLEHHKVGKLQLTLQVRPTDVQSGVQVSDEVKGTVPQATRQAAFYFVDDAGDLHRNDPRQMQFGELREVPPPAVRNEGTDDADG